MKIIEVFIVIWIIFVGGCWIGNVVRLVQCDFEAPYKGEIIHALGLVPGISLVTVWFSNK
jgi:hypothetical protein